MATQWDDWLRQLAAARKGPVTLYASRGRAFETTITLAADYTGSTLRGQVRAAPDAASNLASFTVSGPTVAGGQTSFVISLAAGSGANSTGVLPQDSSGEGSISLPFDLLLTPSGENEELLFGGTLVVLGRITA